MTQNEKENPLQDERIFYESDFWYSISTDRFWKISISFIYSIIHTTMNPSITQNNSLRVEKIGWDDSFQMRNTLTLLRKRESEKERWIYVFSAFKDSISKGKTWNTTDYLIKIAKSIPTDIWIALQNLSKLESHYRELLERELSDNTYRDAVFSENTRAFDDLRKALEYAQKNQQTPTEENDFSIEYDGKTISIMWWWEMLVSRLYSIALWSNQSWIDTYAESPNTELGTLRSEIATRAMRVIENGQTAFVPGYSGNLDGWLHRLAWRGYSDWTAAMIYSGIRKHYSSTEVSFTIRKLFALSSADPRKVEDVQQLTHISYELLLQMIDPSGADAWFVNRAAAMPEIFRNGGYMKVYTDDGRGTIISQWWPENPPKWIQFIQSRRVRKLRIHSYHMNKDGYLAYVSDFLAKRGLSIIDDSSDATTINLMIVVKKKQSWQTEEDYREKERVQFDTVSRDLQEALKLWEEDEESEVSVNHSSHSLIFVGGENIDQPGTLARVTQILADAGVNLWPVVQVDKPKVITFWVDEVDEGKATRLLHKQLIQRDN